MSIKAIHQLSKTRKNGLQALIDNEWIDGFKRLLTDLYPDNAHFIYELLQNAEDAKASEVRFTLNTDSVEFEHNGERLFSIKDVKSITGFGNTTKKDDPRSIGEFGVGFKAVFAYTSTPEIKSGEYHFRIHDLVVPDTEGLSPRTLEENRTHFFLPFDNPQKSPEKACAEIEKNLRQLDAGTLLFLKNIRKIEYLLPDSTEGFIERRETGQENRIGVLVQHPGDSEPISVSFLQFEKEVEVKNEGGKLKPCRIAAAFHLKNKREQAEKKTKQRKKQKKRSEQWGIVPLSGEVSIYFPAEKETSNLRFHLHAPFASTVARDSVRDCPENDELRDHLADLTAESMTTIRDQGLLTVGFLATLPSDKDNLPSFYEPIREQLIKVFKNEKLTPMKRGGHAAASGSYQGSRQLSTLIDDKDLAKILGKDPSLPLWVANAPQRHQEADNFLSSLGISEWDEEKLVSELSVQSDLIQTWLKDKSDKWHQEFYALLGDFLSNTPRSYTYYLSKNHKDTLSALPIVRLSDGTYRKGEDCYFPSDAVERDKRFPRVAKGVYSSGKNKNQQEKALKFLGDDIGVSEVKESDRVKAILDQRYVKGTINLRKRHHEKDLKKFIKLVEDEPSQANLFRNYFIFELDNEKWGMPCAHVFVDHPYLDTGLSAYYEALGRNSDRKRALHPKYKKYGIEPRRIGRFAEAVGAHIKLEPQHQQIPHSHPEYKYLISAPGERRGSERNIDYTIPEFKVLLNRLCIGKARLIWRTMNSLSACHLEARYQKTERWGSRDGKSSLVHDLMKAAWMPQKNGDSFRFVRPCDASVDLLPEEFPYENGKKWLETVKFGENAKKASEEYKKREVLLSSLPIDKEIVDYASGLSPEEQKEMMEDHKRKKARYSDQPTQQGNIPFHKALSDSFVASSKDATEDSAGLGYGGSVKNPSRRRDKTSKSIVADIKKEGEQEIRSYFSAVKKWKGKNDQVRVNLIEWYGGQCQICGKTFTQSNGEPYFEGLYLVSYTTAGWVDRVGNVLCLCPWHSAMFQFGPKEVDEDIIQQILQLKVRAEGGDGQLAIKLRLCGENVEIKFEESHLIDLQEMVKKSQELERPSVG